MKITKVYIEKFRGFHQQEFQYPASQKELLSILRKYSSRLNLQVVFTTHSMSLLESVDFMCRECMKKKATENHIRIVYLSKLNGNVVVNDKASFNKECQWTGTLIHFK